MNPMAMAALGSIVRWVLALGAGYLVKAGIWSGTDAETYVAGAALALLSLGWSVWNKYKGRIKLLKALETPYPTTETHVETMIAATGGPSVSTARGAIPSSTPAP